MNSDKLLTIAVYVRQIRTATQANKLNRRVLEKAILEIDRLRNSVTGVGKPKKPSQNLLDTMETLFRQTEDDIFDYLAALPPTLPTSFQENEQISHC